MNIWDKIKRASFKLEHVAIEELRIDYIIKTESDTTMDIITKKIKLDRPYYDDNEWPSFYMLIKKFEKSHGKEYDKEALGILKKMRNSGYRKIEKGQIVTGNHLVKCDWEINPGNTRKVTDKDWEIHLKHEDE